MTSVENTFGILDKYILRDGFDILLDLEKSHGSWIFDSKRETEYLDMQSFFASLPMGVNHPRLAEEDATKELMLAGRNKVANSDFYTEQYATFLEQFAKVGINDNFKHAFFVSGGALGVENALKTAFDWKVRKNNANGIQGEIGSKILHFKEAFHGRTGYTLSLTNTADPRKYMYFPKFDWPRIDNPKIDFPLEKNLDTIKAREENAYKQMDEAFTNNKNEIAAIIIEPIQAEGGDNHFRPEFFERLRKYADENDAMLIYDEVQTGVGLTGKFWAHEWTPKAKPDIISFGKKMQVCGILATDRVDEIENNVFHESSRINSTWGGNIIDMVRSKYYLKVIEKDHLIDNVNKRSNELLKGLHELAENDTITNVRGKGLLTAFDLKDGATRDKLSKALFDNKMLVLGCGTKSIRFRPALNVSSDEISLALEKLAGSIQTINQ